jgi:hypothetical protein
MPIPATSIINVQVHVEGTAATGGAGVTPAQNIFSFRRTSTAPAFNKASVNTAFQTAIMTPILAAMNVRYTPGNLTVRVLDDAQDSPTNFAVAGVGAIATDSLPSDAAVYILLRTALRGRNYRGSKHFSPASEADTTNDILTGAGLANWQAVRDALVQDFIDADGNTWKNTVVSRNLSNFNLLPVANIVANDVVESLLDLNIGTMRKRRSRTAR